MAGVAELEYTEVACPTCDHKFFPKPRRIETALPTMRASLTADQLAKMEQDKRVEHIREHATLLGVIGILLLVASIFISLNNESSSSGMTLAGAGLLGTAFWLYLVAQIVHIRANTEK